MIRVAALVLAFVAGIVAWPSYNAFALRRGIIAKMNSRTLHERNVPRGGGIVFASVFSIAVLALWLLGGVSITTLLAFGVGGAAAATLGFVDDVREVRATTKFALQLALSLWILIVFWTPLFAPAFAGASAALRVIGVAVLLFVPVWLINLHNFIDGIDGLAMSSVLFTCAAAIVVLLVTGGSSEAAFLFALLATSSAGFLRWNAPPARIFMGDAGSIFFGYCIAALMLLTIVSGDISPWTWIAMLAYYVADTTTTTVCRMFLVKHWYGSHRSHAYQNLARIHQSHGRVLRGVVAYQLLWALPLAIWSSIRPEWAILAAVLALAPAVAWTLRFGPPLSSD
jgi:Fuc2NAc and GlcNAc transferase